MAGTGGVLARYEELSGTLAHLVALVRDRQWEHVPALEARCTALYAQLQAAPPEDLAPEDFARVLVLASRIRRDQDAVQQLVQPQFLQLMRAVDALAQPSPPAA